MGRYEPDWSTDDLGEGLDPIAREAAIWFGIMHADIVSDTNRAQHRSWLRRNPEHQRVYAELEQIWAGAGKLPQARRERRKKAARITRRTAIAGLLALGGSAAIASYLRSYPFAEFRTGAGERRTVELADGSTVELSTRTALSHDFNASLRSITLHEGEAYFRVAPDAARPLVVLAAEGRTQALGTEFSVALNDGDTVVTVTQHAVAVSSGSASRQVEAGNAIAYSGTTLGPVAPADPENSLAWREGRLVFVSRPFGEVIEALNRWSSGQYVLLDGELARRPVTVIIDLDRSENVLEQLQASLPIRTVGMAALVTLILPA